jgi:hypothetical protein
MCPSLSPLVTPSISQHQRWAFAAAGWPPARKSAGLSHGVMPAQRWLHMYEPIAACIVSGDSGFLICTRCRCKLQMKAACRPCCVRARTSLQSVCLLPAQPTLWSTCPPPLRADARRTCQSPPTLSQEAMFFWLTPQAAGEHSSSKFGWNSLQRSSVGSIVGAHEQHRCPPIMGGPHPHT